MPSPVETRRDFLSLAAELSLLSPVAATEILAEAATLKVSPSQLALQRGLLSAAQFDIVETLLRPAEMVPGYEILNLLGQGGMGVVYRARQMNLDRIVALKTVLVSQMADPNAAARFEQEAVTLARLRHPHVVAAYDFGRFQGRLYFAMELVEGEDVEQLIAREGRLDESKAWGLTRQAAAGLAEAARLGVVHRDIKPANLLLVEPPLGFPIPAGMPLVKIADFGLALLTFEADLRTRLTTSGSAVGSPHYMAPEQLDGRDLDTRADMYALGASVFHMLAGQPPFYGMSLSQLIGAKLGLDPPSIKVSRPDVSAETAELVQQMMALDPADRPAGYARLLERIDSLKSLPKNEMLLGATRHFESPHAARGRKRPNSYRSRIVLALILAAFLVAGVGVLLAVFWRDRPLPTKPALVTTGWAAALFDGRTLRGWLPPRGGTWNVSRDEEDAKIISGVGGTIRRPLVRDDLPNQPPLETYRLTLFVNPREATAVEVQFGIQRTSGNEGNCLALRISREGAQIVERMPGVEAPIPRGELRPLGGASSGYHVVMLERAAGHYWVYCDDRLQGALPQRVEPEQAEFRLYVEGGPAWFSDLVAEELALVADTSRKGP